jgi:uncharacterized protein (DUF427 family)
MVAKNQAHGPKVIESPKWVRVFLEGKPVADSKNVLLLRGEGQIPVYYFPQDDVQMDYLEEAEPGSSIARQGPGPWPEPPEGAQVFTVRVNDTSARNAAWLVQKPPDALPELAGHVAFVWNKMEAWYEEDDEVRVHPHDPYHLIDVRHSSRRVKVTLRGEVLAETTRPVLLFETGLPVRFYIPRMDVRMELLEPSRTRTHCGYKGTASYFSARVNGELVEDTAWSYPFPNHQYAEIQNLIAFPQEKVDGFEVDGSSNQ